MTQSKNKWEPLLYSGLGVAAMFLVLVALGTITSFLRVRLDLTEDRLYTLSDGTKRILSKIDTPVVIHFYRTRSSTDMPVFLKTYADRVEDLLAEYQQVARGKIEVKKFDPVPDSDAEDSARLDGIEGQVLSPAGLVGAGDKVYLGLAVTCLDQKAAIPYLDPQREQLLEYDLTRAIAQVINPQKPNLGLMTALPIFGQRFSPMMPMGGGQDPWVFLTELQRDFKVRQIELTAEKIDDDIQVLVVVHPAGISEKAQFAIDQFLLRGGKLIAFLDPLSLVDSRNAMGMQNMLQRTAQASSTLDKLLKAWGLEFDVNKVLADKEYFTQVRRRDDGRPTPEPTWLSLTPQAISREDVATADLDSLLLPAAGVFTGSPAAGLTQTVLLKSSRNSMLVDKMLAQFGGGTDIKDFKPEDKEFTLALRLTGKFKTAFPEGKPADSTAKPEDKKDEDKKADEAGKSEPLKEASQDGVVVLVGDTDLLYDQFCAQIQNFFGQKLIIPFNGNLSFIQNLVEQMMGDSDLIRVRSRGVQRREFEVVKNIQARAEQRYRDTIKRLEDDVAETQRKLNDLLANRDPKNQRVILPPDIQQEIANLRAKEARTNRELKEVRKQLRRDIDALETRLKWLNIAAMPALVAVAGVSLAVIKRKKTAAK